MRSNVYWMIVWAILFTNLSLSFLIGNRDIFTIICLLVSGYFFRGEWKEFHEKVEIIQFNSQLIKSEVAKGQQRNNLD